MDPELIPGSEEACAFCTGSLVVKSYDAAPILIRFASELMLFPQTKWPSCADCSALIDRNQWAELEDRATAAWTKALEASGTPMGYRQQQFVRHELRHLHACIKEAMRGTA
jgi:hypothetical protein